MSDELVNEEDIHKSVGEPLHDFLKGNPRVLKQKLEYFFALRAGQFLPLLNLLNYKRLQRRNLLVLVELLKFLNGFLRDVGLNALQLINVENYL